MISFVLSYLSDLCSRIRQSSQRGSEEEGEATRTDWLSETDVGVDGEEGAEGEGGRRQGRCLPSVHRLQ